MALVLVLSVLLALTVPMLALLSATAAERRIARNLVDSTQALFVAEAGIEWAFDVLASTPDWQGMLAAGGAPPGAPAGPGAPATLVPPAGLLPWGTTTVTLRAGTRPDGAPASTADAAVVVMTSTGRVNRAQRTIEATMRRGQTSPIAGAPAPPAHTLATWRERS